MANLEAALAFLAAWIETGEWTQGERPGGGQAGSSPSCRDPVSLTLRLVEALDPAARRIVAGKRVLAARQLRGLYP